MSQSPAHAIPEGFHTLTPHLVCAGASDAIAFYGRAFGAVELSRLPGPGGLLMHASIRIGDSIVMLHDEFPEMGARGPKAIGGTAVTLHLYTTDADAAFARAVDAGCSVVMPLGDQFWGDRYGVVEDPFGHRWSIAMQLRQLSPQQITEGLQAMAAQGPGCA
ncbi:VOC family protein [Aquabacterium sp. OR-4]|uniref:VOC family protein n=1 Tax=Aquabacterium sp. OR-4 TaxID=2978127 RepID=UPI0021B1D287|nr:VOC family protein [Aquabacterium sp. OR-4]MDT7833713.1 VOC family protein [Aquabacterium sp. OR-4]